MAHAVTVSSGGGLYTSCNSFSMTWLFVGGGAWNCNWGHLTKTSNFPLHALCTMEFIVWWLFSFVTQDRLGWYHDHGIWLDTVIFVVSDLIFGDSDISIMGGADIFPSIVNLLLHFFSNLTHSLIVLYWAIATYIGLAFRHVINFGIYQLPWD